jgi:hypothetical protein
MLGGRLYSLTFAAVALAAAGLADEAGASTWSSFAPVGDAYVSEASPATNYGADPTLLTARPGA